MKSIEKFKIRENASIEQALKVITNGNIKIAIVVNNRDKFIGTLSDGDIRRGFLNGLTINSSIKSLINSRPVIGKEGDHKKKLLKLAQNNQIQIIPIINSRGKLINLFNIMKQINEETKPNLVFVMAGGEGVRLRPLTKNIPKPMLKIDNKPILQIILEKFKSSGYSKFVICVNYKSKKIINYFRDGSKYGVDIEYIQEKKKMGTAGALSLYKKKINEPFFVINGDVLIDLDFKKIIDFHKQNKSIATMCTKQYHFNLPYGEVKSIKEKVRSIFEKPEYKFFVNAGLYVLEPKCINLIPKKFFDMTSVFNKILRRKEKVVSFPLGEHWIDIGQLNDYNKAQIAYSSN